MHKPDFSHYSRITADMVVKAMGKGVRVSDEMYLEALERIDPPLLNKSEMAIVRRKLDPRAERRGRPAKSVPRPAAISRKITNARRADIPPAFRYALAKRLSSNRQLTDSERRLRTGRVFAKRRRDALIASIYDKISCLLNDNAAQVTHPSLGTWPITDMSAPRRDKVLQVTHDILGKHTGLYLPGLDRMKNIVSAYRSGKRRAKT